MPTKPIPSAASSAVELRRALASAPREGVGRPYPAALRLRVVAFVRAELDSGSTLPALADDLGLTPSTLSRWLRAAAPTPAFVPIRLAAAPSPDARGLVVRGPGGLLIEGLSLDQLIALLRGVSS